MREQGKLFKSVAPNGSPISREARSDEVCELAHSEFIHEHANVLGVKVSAIDLSRAVDMADRWVAGGGRGYICVTGVHGVMEAEADAEFQRILNAAVINSPDGMPMSWVGRLQGFSEMDRVFGPDVMACLCERSVTRDYRHFLYGGEPGVAELLKGKLERRFPGIQIVEDYLAALRAQALSRIHVEHTAK